MKGAVGTQASFQDILSGTGMNASDMEANVMQTLELAYFPIATQTYTRQQDLIITQLLAAVAAALHKFALDFRILQSPPFGEWAEPFAEKQVGSSAMPFKRNPINTENVCSLARYVAAMRKSCGITPARLYWSAAWMIPPIEESFWQRVFLPLMNCWFDQLELCVKSGLMKKQSAAIWLFVARLRPWNESLWQW